MARTPNPIICETTREAAIIDAPEQVDPGEQFTVQVEVLDAQGDPAGDGQAILGDFDIESMTAIAQRGIQLLHLLRQTRIEHQHAGAHLDA